MSFEEKTTWIYAFIAVVVPPFYFANVLGQLSTTPVADIAYQWPLLNAVGAAIVLAIIGAIVISISSPKEAGKADQRDKDISRLGEYVTGLVLAVGVLVPFGLAMLEVDHFWIANAIYAAFLLSAIAGTVAKIVAYRRGF